MSDATGDPPTAHPSAQSDRLGMTLVAAAMLLLAGAVWLASGGRTLAVAAPSRGEAPYRVDVNVAEWPELSLVPGLGGVLSQRIVEYREQHGAYELLDDLTAVHGIGALRLEAIRPYLTLTGRSASGGECSDGP